MPQSSPLTFADATSWLTPTAPPPESADRSAALASQFVERARRQDAFYDDVALTPAQFRQTSTYLACRGELFLLCHRLMSLLPATGPDADTAVAQAVGQQAAGWSRLATGIDDPQAQMFGCGKHLMLALCEALENDRRPETQALAARHLRAAFHGEALHPGAVTAIGGALSQVLAAGRTDDVDRRRQTALHALTEWARVRDFPHWKPAEVAAAFLEYLGVDEEPDVTPDTAFNPAATGAPIINAAYAACAKAWAADRPQAQRLQAQGVPEMDRVGRRLRDGGDRLRANAARYGVVAGEAVDRFVKRFIGAAPTGGQEDMVGNLHRFGLDALERLCERLEADGADPDRGRAALQQLFDRLGRTKDPAALLLGAVRYWMPVPDRSAAERNVEDVARRGAVRDAVVRSAEPLLTPLSQAARARILDKAVERVTDLLGIDQTVGGCVPPTTSGLFDVSTESLAALLQETRDAAGRAVHAWRDNPR